MIRVIHRWDSEEIIFHTPCGFSILDCPPLERIGWHSLTLSVAGGSI